MNINRILYVSHRYHTNQAPIIHGWHEMGVQVMFLAIYQGVIEDDKSSLIFKLIRPSLLTKIRHQYISKHYNSVQAEAKKYSVFIPEFFALFLTIKKFNPDIAILREYHKTNAMVSFICRILGIKCIMYNQSPVYGNNAHKSKMNYILHCLFFPRNVCFSPILYRCDAGNSNIKSVNPFAPQWYIPFVEKFRLSERSYCKDGIIHILVVAKYRAYKNIDFVVNGLALCKEHLGNVKVDIYGQLSNDVEKSLYDKLKALVASNGLSDIISLHEHVSYNEINMIYSQNDILILPSKTESAGMVILEAMAHGLCVMGSKTCGLSFYLDKYECGYVFDVSVIDEFVSQISFILQNPNVIAEMGQKAHNVVKENMQFENYVKALSDLLKEEYGYEL